MNSGDTNSKRIRDQTLDQLERTTWAAPAQDSYVISNVHRLRRVPLKHYRLEDLRLMIGQQVGLEFLVPIALDHLELHPRAEGDFYPGDLLVAVVQLPKAYWLAHRSLIARALCAIDAANQRLRKIDAPDELATKLQAARDGLLAIDMRR